MRRIYKLLSTEPRKVVPFGNRENKHVGRMFVLSLSPTDSPSST